MTVRSAWHRPGTCNCGKIPYPDEAAALRSAERAAGDLNTDFQVYKCPGHSSWHKRTRGFHPRALKSRARILAWHLDARRVVDRDWLLEAFEIPPGCAWASQQGRKLAKTIGAFAKLGLISVDDPRPSYITVTDEAGLRRVMAVGLEEYAESRGIDITLRSGRRRGASGDGEGQ
jgi:hypothetical protein